MTLLDHARTELAIAQRDEDMAAEQPIASAILAIIEDFAGQGHSGGSASIVGPRIEWIIGRLLAFDPITPLTGAPSEWLRVSDGMSGGKMLEQNIRCSRVFRELVSDSLGAGVWIAYDTEAVVFREWRGRAQFSGWDSARRISFPYLPPERPRVTRFRRLSRTWARLCGQLRP